MRPHAGPHKRKRSTSNDDDIDCEDRDRVRKKRKLERDERTRLSKRRKYLKSEISDLRDESVKFTNIHLKLMKGLDQRYKRKIEAQKILISALRDELGLSLALERGKDPAQYTFKKLLKSAFSFNRHFLTNFTLHSLHMKKGMDTRDVDDVVYDFSMRFSLRKATFDTFFNSYNGRKLMDDEGRRVFNGNPRKVNFVKSRGDDDEFFNITSVVDSREDLRIATRIVILMCSNMGEMWRLLGTLDPKLMVRLIMLTKEYKGMPIN